MDDNGERYKLLHREIAIAVIRRYSPNQTKNQAVTIVKVIESAVIKYAQRPKANKRKES
jgi:hypothetical protein